MFSKTSILIEVMSTNESTINSDNFLNILLAVQIVTFIIMCGLLWLYYRIIYGILLKKLKKNYLELESLEN